MTGGNDWTDREFYGLALKTAKKNIWKFYRSLEVDDLMQEFAICFVRAKRHCDPTRGRAALMYLFKQAMEWRLIDLGQLYIDKHRLNRCVQASHVESMGGVHYNSHSFWGYAEDRPDFTDLLGFCSGSTLSEATVRLALDEAPDIVRLYVEKKLSGTLLRTKRNGKKETPREAITRLTGIPVNRFYGMVRAWAESSLELAPLSR